MCWRWAEEALIPFTADHTESFRSSLDSFWIIWTAFLVLHNFSIPFWSILVKFTSLWDIYWIVSTHLKWFWTNFKSFLTNFKLFWTNVWKSFFFFWTGLVITGKNEDEFIWLFLSSQTFLSKQSWNLFSLFFWTFLE